jgi:hypothetical protein
MKRKLDYAQSGKVGFLKTIFHISFAISHLRILLKVQVGPKGRKLIAAPVRAWGQAKQYLPGPEDRQPPDVDNLLSHLRLLSDCDQCPRPHGRGY